MASSQVHGIVNSKTDDATDHVDETVTFRDDDEKPRGRLMSFKLFKIMTSHGKEFVFVLAVIFTAYAAFQNSPLKTRKAPFPQRFFPKNSLVTDYFAGEVLQAFERLRHSDITLVMYYAPWDATSMEVQKEFEKTAKYYHDQVYFAAINCWWPEGECRHNFPKLHPFPILIAYHSTGKGVHFHGTPTFPHLVRFLDRVITPLTVVQSASDIFKLLVEHDVVVLGFFDFQHTQSPSGYHSFYMAATKALEKDPHHTIAFAIVSNQKDASSFGFNATKSIQLHAWNSTHEFVSNGTVTSTEILKWALSKQSEVVKWLVPPGVKSQLLSKILETSPTIMMLTPRFVTADLLWSPYYLMLKELALDYFDCNRSPRIDGIIHHATKEIREWNSETLRSKNAQRNVEDVAYESFNSCCHSAILEGAKMACDICIANMNCDSSKWTQLHHRLVYGGSPSVGCSHMKWNVDGHMSVCCCKEKNRTGCGRPDFQVSNRATRPTLNRYRHLLEDHAHVMPFVTLPKGSAFRKRDANFTGLGCRTNQTLTFVAMDSLQYNDFFDRLGTKVLDNPPKTEVVIIHAKQELHYTLKKGINVQTLREFITNYTHGVLSRHSRSSEGRSAEVLMSEDQIAVQEVTSANFHEIVMDEQKDVMVMIYAPWCAFCSGIAHIYLSVARYFHSTKDVVFVRINGDANDLPWELTAGRYPTIIFFPAHRKADSIEYPDDVPITVTSLIQFVLAHSQREIRMRTALSLCSAQCISHNRKLAISKIRRLLHQYRTTDGRLRNQLDVLREQCPIVENATCTVTEYARYLVSELCRVRTHLRHAKTLHFILGTTESDHLSRNQLEMLIDSHGDYRGSLMSEQCQDLTHTLDATLKSCQKQTPGLVVAL